MRCASGALLALALIGCGGGDGDDATDLTDSDITDAQDEPVIDAADGTPDAAESTPDASAGAPDATPASSVVVTPNCAGIDEVDIVLDITNVNASGFSNESPVIAVGDTIRFTSTGSHNMASTDATPDALAFRSGDIGTHVACLQFNAVAVIDFRCQLHAGMTGTITIE
jgi:plastocyanin